MPCLLRSLPPPLPPFEQQHTVLRLSLFRLKNASATGPLAYKPLGSIPYLVLRPQAPAPASDCLGLHFPALDCQHVLAVQNPCHLAAFAPLAPCSPIVISPSLPFQEQSSIHTFAKAKRAKHTRVAPGPGVHTKQITGRCFARVPVLGAKPFPTCAVHHPVPIPPLPNLPFLTQLSPSLSARLPLQCAPFCAHGASRRIYASVVPA